MAKKAGGRGFVAGRGRGRLPLLAGRRRTDRRNLGLHNGNAHSGPGVNSLIPILPQTSCPSCPQPPLPGLPDAPFRCCWLLLAAAASVPARALRLLPHPISTPIYVSGMLGCPIGGCVWCAERFVRVLCVQRR